MSNSRCAWCENPFKARMNGGSMQIFCCKTHRYEFRLALIAHSQALLVSKKITMEDLRASKALADTAYKRGQWVRL